MRTMLLRKDWPWIGAFVVSGLAALAPATIDGGFLRTFVLTPATREGLFFAAWIAGIALGVFAACFDEALGARELLAQRPLSSRRVLQGRVLGCAVVLATWFALAPFAAYALCGLTDRKFELGYWRQWPSILAAMVPAISACAVGLLAGSLPFVWWGRLWCLAAAVLVPFSAIHWLQCSSASLVSSLPWFVGGHLVVALGAVCVVFAIADTRRDADRPLASGARVRVVAPLLAVLAALMAVMCGGVAKYGLGRLRAAYPEAGTEKGRIVLSIRDEHCRHVVDEHHVATGKRLTLGSRWFVECEPGVAPPAFFRIEGPRWQAAESHGFHGKLAGTLYTEADGCVFWDPSLVGGLQRVAKPDGTSFAPGTTSFGRNKGSDLAVAEPGGSEIWLFDVDRVTVESVPLPDGDRVLGTEELHRAGMRRGFAFLQLVDTPAELTQESSEKLVCGERGVYALRDGKLVAAGKLPPRDTQPISKWRGRVDAPDMMTWTLTFDGADGVPPFTHTFTPRTFAERTFAGVAMVASLPRPPLLQTAGALMPARGLVRAPEAAELHAVWWLFDPLVAGGRRWWLVLASVVFAALLACAARARLRRLGADAATVRFWTVATVLLGFVGWAASAVCETKRAWADRRIAVPAPAPRIVSPSKPAEVVA